MVDHHDGYHFMQEPDHRRPRGYVVIVAIGIGIPGTATTRSIERVEAGQDASGRLMVGEPRLSIYS